MSAAPPAAVGVRRDSNAYSLFIFVLTVLSLLIMVALVVRMSDPAGARGASRRERS